MWGLGVPPVKVVKNVVGVKGGFWAGPMSATVRLSVLGDEPVKQRK